MGARGPGSGRLKAVAALATDTVLPWEKDGMPSAERVLSFLGELPIVSGLRAGEKMELLGFQEQFVRGVYAETEGERKVRLAGLSVGRGNGKSGLLSGLSLAHLLGPMNEPYGEAYRRDALHAGVLARGWRAGVDKVPSWRLHS